MPKYILLKILSSPLPAKPAGNGDYTQQFTIQVGIEGDTFLLSKPDKITITYNENDSTKRIGELATEAAEKLVNEKYNGNYPWRKT